MQRRRPKTRFGVAAAIGAAFALVAGFGVADAVTGAAKGVDPEVAELLATFRGPRTPADDLPSDAQMRLEESGDAQPGEMPGESRHLGLKNGHAAFVWPMDRGICYASAGPSGCFPTRVLTSRGAMVGSSGSADAQTTRVFAIARDGVREIEFILKDGRSVRVPVVENALLEDLPQPPREARWVNTDGVLTIQREIVPRFMLE